MCCETALWGPICCELPLPRKWEELVLVEPDAMPTLVGMLTEVGADVTEEIRRSEDDEVTKWL